MHRSRIRHVVLGALLVTSLSAAGPALAATRTTTTPWIALSASPSTPALGSLVTFDSGYPSNIKSARIEVLCYQGGQLVYGEAGSADQAVQQSLTGYPGFVLGGSASVWKTAGGPASCTANLFYFGSKSGAQTYNRLATTSFDATI
jgi:hypothetical protein